MEATKQAVQANGEPVVARQSARVKRKREAQHQLICNSNGHLPHRHRSASSTTDTDTTSTTTDAASAATTLVITDNDIEPTAKQPALTLELAAPDDRKKEHWQAHQLADDYVELSCNIALQSMGEFGPFGIDPTFRCYPIESVSTLSFLKSPMRRTSILERWSPIDVALFEASLAEYGKEFHKVAREIPSKSTSEVIDFYYIWKKTKHYTSWKKEYIPPHLDVMSDDEEFVVEPAPRKPPSR